MKSIVALILLGETHIASFTAKTLISDVGYMEKASVNENGYSWVVNTFERVDGQPMTLADLSLKEENYNPGAATLFLFTKTGATLVVGEKPQKFVWLSPTKAASKAGLVSGWYYQGTSNKNMTGPGSAGWANDTALPYGQGFALQCSDILLTLQFNGQVRKSDMPIAAVNENGYTFMGNVMPVDGYTLADFTLAEENYNPGAATLYFFSKTGATLVEGGKAQKFVWLSPTKAASKAGLVSGWYYQGTSTKTMTGPGSEGWANDKAVAAGQGFALQCSDILLTLKVPSPLAD